MRFIFSLFLVTVASCQTARFNYEAKGFSRFGLAYLNQKIELSHERDVSNLHKTLDGADIYISNYLDIPADRQQHFINLKKRNFIDLFQEDIEPYSRSVFKRNLCLVQQDEDSVVFNSGVEMYWSNCVAANKKYASSAKSIRFWRYCQNTLWEVTVKSLEVYNKMSATCNDIQLLNDLK